MDLQGNSDRLVVCVHHPSMAEDAGMDLYEILKEHEVAWDGLGAAAVGEYRYLGKPTEGPEVMCRPGGIPLFPSATNEYLV